MENVNLDEIRQFLCDNLYNEEFLKDDGLRILVEKFKEKNKK
jgi:hypothetical protein